MTMSTRETRQSVVRLRSQKKNGKGIFVRLVQFNNAKGSAKNPNKGTRCHRTGCFQCDDHQGSEKKPNKKKTHRAQQRGNNNKGSEKKAKKECRPRLRQCENNDSEKKAIAPIDNAASNIIIAQEGQENGANFEEEWEVSEVQFHRMCPETLEPLFKVKYTGYPGYYYQPAKDLLTCPRMVEQMEEKTGLQMRKV